VVSINAEKRLNSTGQSGFELWLFFSNFYFSFYFLVASKSYLPDNSCRDMLLLALPGAPLTATGLEAATAACWAAWAAMAAAAAEGRLPNCWLVAAANEKSLKRNDDFGVQSV
jgi:hypothetical protein